MVWRIDDPQGNEAAKVKYSIVRYTRGVGFDLGCGPYKAFPHFIGVDSAKDTELFGIPIKPDLTVADAARLSDSVNAASADFIFSSHLLEHIDDTRAALADWWSCLKVGGFLILYLPHADLYPRIGQPGANPDHKHDFLPTDLVVLMAATGSFDLHVNQTRDAGREYSFLQVYEKLADGEACRFTCEKKPPAKRALVVRHGGIGDQIQAAYLLPELKRQGYHVTMLTTPKGREPIAHDPNIDAWYMVDVDQVPNHELGAFWRATAKDYDRFINLNESVEGTFLALPGRIAHTWPHALRHKMLNHNYAEHAAALADIPFVPEGRFYPTRDESAWADSYIAGLQNEFGPYVVGANDALYLIVWAMSGSSPHKFTPHQDAVIAEVLKRLKRAVIVLTGDTACKLLEQGWEQTKRVRCEAGVLGVREVLTLAQRAACVIGPETGTLNAVAYEPNFKVVLLSHSSPENLTKHWFNTIAVEGVAPCYPCHQLHYDRTYCPSDPETHVALCQRDMNPADIYAAIDADYTAWARIQLLRNVA